MHWSLFFLASVSPRDPVIIHPPRGNNLLHFRREFLAEIDAGGRESGQCRAF